MEIVQFCSRIWLGSGCKGELRDDDEFSQFESGRDCLFAESGGVVLVSAADFLDKAMSRKTLQQAGYLAAVQFRQVAAEGLILQSADAELAAKDGTEEHLVVRIEHVEAAIAASFLLDALGKFVELVAPGARIFDRREELQIASVGGFEQFAQSWQVVDRFLHAGPFGFTWWLAGPH